MAKSLYQPWLFPASTAVEHMTQILRSMVQILPLTLGESKWPKSLYQPCASSVVDCLTYNPKTKGSNPTTVIRREKWKKSYINHGCALLTMR